MHGDGVGKVCGHCRADECDSVDGNGHVLGGDGVFVAEAIDERGIEVGESGGSDDDLNAVSNVLLKFKREWLTI